MVGRRYNDDHYEYRHVQLPKQMLKKIPKDYFDGQRGTLGITQVRSKDREPRRTGKADAYLRVWGGNTTRCTNPSRTFCCSSKSSKPHIACAVGVD